MELPYLQKVSCLCLLLGKHQTLAVQRHGHSSNKESCAFSAISTFEFFKFIKLTVSSCFYCKFYLATKKLKKKKYLEDIDSGFIYIFQKENT